MSTTTSVAPNAGPTFGDTPSPERKSSARLKLKLIAPCATNLSSSGLATRTNYPTTEGPTMGETVGPEPDGPFTALPWYDRCGDCERIVSPSWDYCPECGHEMENETDD